jgi:hypothetical protein
MRRARAWAAAIALFAAAPVAAQPAPEPAPAPQPVVAQPAPSARVRGGFMAGFDAGVGEMSLECAVACGGSFDHSGAVAVHAGLMIDDNLAALYDGWLLVHLDDSPFGDVLVLHSLHIAALQGWLTPRLWLRGGAGLAHMRIRFEEIGRRSDTVPALAGAVGYEVMRRGRMVLDVTFRLGAGFYDQDDGQDETVYNAALGAGLSWY